MFSGEFDVMVRKEQIADEARAQAHARLVREVEQGMQPRPQSGKVLSLKSIAHSVLSVLRISHASRPLPLQ